MKADKKHYTAKDEKTKLGQGSKLTFLLRS